MDERERIAGLAANDLDVEHFHADALPAPAPEKAGPDLSIDDLGPPATEATTPTSEVRAPCKATGIANA